MRCCTWRLVDFSNDAKAIFQPCCSTMLTARASSQLDLPLLGTPRRARQGVCAYALLGRSCLTSLNARLHMHRVLRVRPQHINTERMDNLDSRLVLGNGEKRFGHVFWSAGRDIPTYQRAPLPHAGWQEELPPQARELQCTWYG